MDPNRAKVLQFICPSGFYGAERWILALSKNFDAERIQCDLAVTCEDSTIELDLTKHYRDECSSVGDAFELPMSGRFDIMALKRLTDLIKTRNIDIIHTHGYKSDILGVIAARYTGIKCVVTPHGFENVADLKLQFFIWLGCKAMSFADKVVPLSTQIILDVEAHGVKDSRVTYIQNGVDLSEIESLARRRTATKTNDNIIRIGFIGQMISRKNLFDMIDVFATLCESHDNLELQLIGDGEQRDALERHAAGLIEAGKIKFLGFRNNRLEYLANLDLFCLTSTLEGIPRCLMEAMAMGVPVAAYNVPGVDQLIAHEKTGLLAKLGDKNALAANWQRILTDSRLANGLAKNAKTFVQQYYSARRMADEYLELYNEMLS